MDYIWAKFKQNRFLTCGQLLFDFCGHPLLRYLCGDARLSATTFPNLTGMLSGPQEQSLLISLISLMTSAHVTGRKQKACSWSTGKEFTKSNKFSTDWASAPVTRTRKKHLTRPGPLWVAVGWDAVSYVRLAIKALFHGYKKSRDLRKIVTKETSHVQVTFKNVHFFKLEQQRIKQLEIIFRSGSVVVTLQFRNRREHFVKRRRRQPWPPQHQLSTSRYQAMPAPSCTPTTVPMASNWLYPRSSNYTGTSGRWG